MINYIFRKHHLIFEDGIAILRISDIDEDRLEITCSAFNNRGRVMTSCKMRRSDASESEATSTTTSSGITQKPHFVVPLKDVFTMADRYTLKAIVTGNPLPNIYWTLDGEPFEPK